MTRAEKQRIERMLSLGCAACAELWLWHTAEDHHIVEGREMGHWYTIPLCPGHHRNLWSEEQVACIQADERVSIAHGRKAFLEVFSSEKELWLRVKRS